MSALIARGLSTDTALLAALIYGALRGWFHGTQLLRGGLRSSGRDRYRRQTGRTGQCFAALCSVPVTREVREDLEHPRGGQAHYTAESLRVTTPATYEATADSLLDDGGETGMATGMELLSESIEVLAPVDTTRLRHSGHPVVESDEQTVYDRPPIAAREEQR